MILSRKVNTFIHYLKTFNRKRYYGFVNGNANQSNEKIVKLRELVGHCETDIVNNFEAEFSQLIGDGESISFAAARMGFYSLMTTLGICDGDEVILAGHTCSVMPNAVWRTGATPIFADIDLNTFGSCAVEIEKVISDRTKMIVAQHSFGIPCNIKPIVDLARSKGIFLLEDCAITLGSKVNGVQVGNFGNAALFSIDHTKPINAIMGGLIYTRKKELYLKLKEIQKSSDNLPAKRLESLWRKLLFERKHFNPQNYGKSLLLSKINSLFIRDRDTYLMDDNKKTPSNTYPYPAKLPTFLAHLGRLELECWEMKKKNRINLLNSFLELADSVGITEFLPISYFNKNLEIVPLRFVYTHPYPNAVKKRMSKYVDVNYFWFTKPIIVCRDPCDLGYEYGSCPVSEKVGNEIINWPCIFPSEDNEKLLKYFEIVHA